MKVDTMGDMPVPKKDNDHPRLSETETKEAMKALYTNYPSVIRGVVDPIYQDQRFVNVSYLFHKTPKVLKDGNKIYGYVKIRGVYRSEGDARDHARKIIKNHDSSLRIKVGQVGTFLPITDSSLLEEQDPESVMVDDEEGKPVPLDLALAREKVEQERAKQEELKKREEELKKRVEEVNKGEEAPITKYITAKVKERYLKETLVELRKQIAEVEGFIDKTKGELAALGTDADFPHWLPVYNAERKKSGLDPVTEEYFMINV